jgi:hypothetical protein
LKNLDEYFKEHNKLKRINGQYISHEIQHLLHLEKGFLFTVKELLLRPGKAIRAFIFEDREKYVKPVVFLIFCSVVFNLMMYYSKIQWNYFNIDQIRFGEFKNNLRTKEIGAWTKGHLGYTNLIMGIFIGFGIKLFFRKEGYNVFEIFVALCYILGEAMLINGLLLVSIKVFKTTIFVIPAISSYFIYIVWAVGQFFGEKKTLNYVKAALSYILGNMLYLCALILISFIYKQVTT